MEESIRSIVGVKGRLPLEVTTNLGHWRNDLNKINVKIDLLEEDDEVSNEDPGLAELRRKRTLAQLQVEGWEIALVQSDSTEIKSYLERQLNDVIAKIEATKNTPAGSSKSSTTSGSH